MPLKVFFGLILTLLITSCSPTSKKSEDSSVSTQSSCQKSCTIESVTQISIGLSRINSDFSSITAAADKTIFQNNCLGAFAETSRSFTTEVSRTNGHISFVDDILLANNAFYRPLFAENSNTHLKKTIDTFNLPNDRKANISITGFFRSDTKTIEFHSKTQKFAASGECVNDL